MIPIPPFLAKVVVLILSSMLFAWGCLSKKNAFFSFANAFYIIILPFALSPHLGKMTFVGVPVYYYPFIAALCASLIRFQGWKFHIGLKRLVFIFLSLIIIVFFLAVIRPHTLIATMPYLVMYVLYFVILFVYATVMTKIDEQYFLSIAKKIVFINAIGCFIGIMKLFFGWHYDANYIALCNRNFTAFILPIAFLFLLFIREKKYVSNIFFYVCFILYWLCIFGITSRMGIFAFVLIYLFYYFNGKSLKSIILFLRKRGHYFLIVLLIVAILLVSPQSKQIFHKVNSMFKMIELVIYNYEAIDFSYGDSTRIMTLVNGIELIKKNVFLGTGPGLKNYLNELKKIELRKSLRMNAHNFYVTYFAELGIFGILVYLYLFIKIKQRFKFISDPVTRKCFNFLWWSVMFMFNFAEYVSIPILWVLWGMGLGISLKDVQVSNKNVEIEASF